MRNSNKPIKILVADDDPDDRLFMREALADTPFGKDLSFVTDGEDLMDYLYRRGSHTNLSGEARPGLILLDLNMPRKDGREALKEIKTDPALRSIPVVVLTTSKAEEDVFHTYELGVSSFITKPTSFDGLVEVMHALGKYWFELVELPVARS